MAKLYSESPSDLPSFWRHFLASPMSRVQKLAIVALFAMCALDGFDIFAITFAAPLIAAEFGLGEAQIGIVFSAALAGMALGALLFAPFADIYGRRNLLVVSLSLMIGGTLWTCFSSGMSDFIISRLLTGFGAGTVAVVINPLAAEYSNTIRRDFSVTIVALGYPIGAMLGGLLSAWVLPAWGWRPLFLIGSGLGTIMLLIVLFWLPEPVAGILMRPGPNALDRLNNFLRRCGQPQLKTFPSVERKQRKRSLGFILGPNELAHTLIMTSIFFLFSLSLYYIQSWIPLLIVSAGHTVSNAALASTAMSIGGISGGAVLASLALRLGLKEMVVFAIGLTALAIGLFGFIPAKLYLLLTMAFIVGLGTIGGMSNLYAILSRSFPADARAAGIGFVIGIGRVGSAVGPGLGGILFSLGYEREGVSLIMALPAFIAASLLVLHKVRNFA